MATLLNGKTVSASILKRVEKEVSKLHQRGVRPKLAFILVGSNPASLAYVGKKEKACDKVGIAYERHDLSARVSTKKLIALIETLNKKKSVHGILVQLPLPQHIEEPLIIRAINPQKDVDGFHAYNVGKMLISKDFEYLSPCTPTGVIKILEYYNIPVKGKNVVVIGRSNIVGKPVAAMLINRGATVTVCHSKTKNTAKHTRNADIIVVATGVPGLLKGNMVKKGCTVIDVGFNRLPSGKIVGDVVFNSVKKKAKAITPVPGGIGPMTVACLMENIVKAATYQ